MAGFGSYTLGIPRTNGWCGRIPEYNINFKPPTRRAANVSIWRRAYYVLRGDDFAGLYQHHATIAAGPTRPMISWIRSRIATLLKSTPN